MDTLAETEMLGRLALALGIGLLVGIERGWHTLAESGGERIAGIRTYALVGLMGGVWGLLGSTLGDVVLGFGFLGFALLVLYAYRSESKTSGDRGMTSEVASFLVFALGALAVRGDMVLAAASGVAVAALLDAKRYLHGWLHRLSQMELDSALQLLVISVVVLPVLPDQGFGPGQVLNPFRMWLMVVLVAAISFSGYIALNMAGPRLGGLVTGLFGGLVSSTAVTLSFARLGGKSKTLAPMLVSGIAVANAVMLVRVVFVAGLFNTAIIPLLAPILGAMAAANAIGAAILFARARKQVVDAELDITNPCDIPMAVKFGLLLAAVALASHFADQWFGHLGLYAAASAAGLVDVDAIALSMAQMAGSGAAPERVAATAILAAASVNTAVKTVFVAFISGRTMALPMGAVSAVVLAAGGLTLAAL